MPRDLLAEQANIQQPRNLLAEQTQSSQQVQPEGTTISNALQNLLGISPTILETPLVAAQKAQEFGLGIPGVKSGLAALANLLPGVQGVRREDIQPTPVIDKPTTGAKVLGTGLAALGTGELAAVPAAGALRALPIAEKVATAAPRLARTAGSALFGALADPESRLRGAITGGALGTGAETLGAIPGIARTAQRGAAKLLSPFSPQQDFENILNRLSGGKGIEENSKILAKEIRNKYKDLTSKNSNNFENVLSEVGSKNIDFPSYNDEFKNSIKLYNRKLKDVHNNFLKNPTFDNAHKLRVDLGTAANRFKIITRQDLDEKETLDAAQNALRNDMDNFLKTTPTSRDFTKEYQDAIDFHRDEVVPYKSKTKIFNIAKGDIKNPGNTTSIFKFPEEEKHEKVINDLSQESKNRIVFNELEKAKNPQSLIKQFETLDRKGLGSYVSPELRDDIENLNIKLGRSELLQRAGGAIGGALAGTTVGAPTVGAITGTLTLPRLLRGLSKARPGVNIQQGKSLDPRMLQLLVRSFLANNSGQQRGTQ